MADIASPLNPLYEGPVASAEQIGRSDGSSVETSLVAVESRVSLDFTNPDVLMQLVDTLNHVIAQFGTDNTFSAKFALGAAKNGLAVRQQLDGNYAIELGAKQGEQPLADWIASSDYYNPDVSVYFLTSDFRVLFEVRTGANSLYSNSAPATTPTPGAGLGDWTAATDYYNPDVEIYMTTKDGRVLFERGNSSLPSLDREIITARGTTRNLDTRFAPMIRPDGSPTETVYGKHLLRWTHAIMRQLARGVAGTVLSICLTGDSWTDNGYYVPIMVARLRAQFGDAGDGFIPALRGGASGVATETLDAYAPAGGSFESLNSVNGGPLAPGAALSAFRSSSVGFKVVYKPSKQQDRAFLHAVGNGAVVRYRKDGGAWTQITLDGAALRVDEMAVGGSYSLIEVELVSGTVTIAGIDNWRNVVGIRFNNLGAGSGSLDDVAAVSQADYITSLAAMKPNLITTLWGTNEAGRAHTVEKFMTNFPMIIGRFRAAAPLADLLAMSAPQSLSGTNAYLMPLYNERTRTFCLQQGIAHVDGQLLFGGRDPARYGDAGYQFMGAFGEGGGDLFHPTNRGASLIESTLESMIVE